MMVGAQLLTPLKHLLLWFIFTAAISASSLVQQDHGFPQEGCEPSWTIRRKGTFDADTSKTYVLFAHCLDHVCDINSDTTLDLNNCFANDDGELKPSERSVYRVLSPKYCHDTPE